VVRRRRFNRCSQAQERRKPDSARHYSAAYRTRLAHGRIISLDRLLLIVSRLMLLADVDWQPPHAGPRAGRAEDDIACLDPAHAVVGSLYGLLGSCAPIEGLRVDDLLTVAFGFGLQDQVFGLSGATTLSANESHSMCIESTLAALADNKGLTGRATQAALSRDPVSHFPRYASCRG
jgi:hypothetical protein